MARRMTAYNVFGQMNPKASQAGLMERATAVSKGMLEPRIFP
jgi:hypothetical protein